MAADERPSRREEANFGDETNAQPALRRDARVRAGLPAGAPRQPQCPRHGLRPHRTQRGNRARAAGTEERPQRGEALERDADESEDAGDEVARAPRSPVAAFHHLD